MSDAILCPFGCGRLTYIAEVHWLIFHAPLTCPEHDVLIHTSNVTEHIDCVLQGADR